MTIFPNLITRHEIYLKFGVAFKTSLNKLLLEAKANIITTIKTNYFYIDVTF